MAYFYWPVIFYTSPVYAHYVHSRKMFAHLFNSDTMIWLQRSENITKLGINNKLTELLGSKDSFMALISCAIGFASIANSFASFGVIKFLCI